MLILLTFSCQLLEGWPMTLDRCSTQMYVHIPAEWGKLTGNVSGIYHFRNCWSLPISLSCNISGIESEWSICHSNQLEAIYTDWKCPGKSVSAIDCTRSAKWHHSLTKYYKNVKSSIKIYDIHLQANVGQCNWDIKSLQNEIKKQRNKQAHTQTDNSVLWHSVLGYWKTKKERKKQRKKERKKETKILGEN